MSEFINFIITNKRLILEVVILIISVVVFILRKKPVNDILSYIYQACLNATKDVENSGIKGPEQKLACAVQIVCETLKAYFPNLDIKNYSTLIVATIEAVLETPQKKQ